MNQSSLFSASWHIQRTPASTLPCVPQKQAATCGSTSPSRWRWSRRLHGRSSAATAAMPGPAAATGAAAGRVVRAATGSSQAAGRRSRMRAGVTKSRRRWWSTPGRRCAAASSRRSVTQEAVLTGTSANSFPIADAVVGQGRRCAAIPSCRSMNRKNSQCVAVLGRCNAAAFFQRPVTCLAVDIGQTACLLHALRIAGALPTAVCCRQLSRPQSTGMHCGDGLLNAAARCRRGSTMPAQLPFQI